MVRTDVSRPLADLFRRIRDTMPAGQVTAVEEPTLQHKFGDSYTHYRHTVRRWLPTRPS